MFDYTTTDAWRAERRAKDLAEVEKNVEDSRALFDTVRESSKRRGYQGTPSLSPLAKSLLGQDE